MILIISIIGFIALIYAVHGGIKYTRMIGNIFLSLVYNPVTEYTQSSLGEKVTILDSSDHEIEALLVENKSSKKIMIFCHESGASKDSWEKYAFFVPSLGFHLLSFDLKNSSKQNEESFQENTLSQWPTRENIERLLMVIRWTKKALSAEKIVLFGVSNGADVAFAAASEEPAVRAVIADGLFSMKEIFRDYIRKWAPILVKPNIWGKKLPEWLVTIFTNLGFWYCQKKSKTTFIDVEAFLKKPHPPLLMIHGEGDDYIPETHQRFLEKISSKKNPLTHFIVPNAGHNESVIVAKKAYEENIKLFLQTL